LGLSSDQFSSSFQSRLGQDEWIKPFTVERLESFPKEGVKRLLVACPAFVSDCLETLEEMAIRGKKTFMDAGGESFRMIPCLNTFNPWLKTFAGYCNSSASENATLWKTGIA
jgi:ferrochelatase